MEFHTELEHPYLVPDILLYSFLCNLSICVPYVVSAEALFSMTT